ncbi:MAG: hypothetical protein K940chlam6_00821 [Chlamydiae bacterium]|nr:hypothetical protein [Chlamydiota bacterium]
MVSIVGSQSNPFSKDHSHRKENSLELVPIRKKIDALAKRMGVEVPYKLKIGNGWAAQYRFFNKKHVIWVPKDALNSKHQEFYLGRNNPMVIMHELTHLAKKHKIVRLSGNLIFSVVVAILGAVYLPFLWLISVFACIGGFFSSKILCYFQEKEADAIACQYATDQEKLQFIYYLKVNQSVNIMYRNQKDLPLLERWKRKIQFTPCGGFRFDIHPYDSSRIRMVESTMKVKPKKHLPLENYINIRRRAYRGNEFSYWYACQIVLDENGNLNSIFNKNKSLKLMISIPIFLIEQTLKSPFFFLKYHFAPRSALEDEIGC